MSNSQCVVVWLSVKGFDPPGKLASCYLLERIYRREGENELNEVFV